MLFLHILNISTAASNPLFEYVFDMNRYLESSASINQNGFLSLNHIIESSKLINDYINTINNYANHYIKLCNDCLISLGALCGKITNIGIAFQENRMVECMDEIVRCKDKIKEIFNSSVEIHNKSVINDLHLIDPTEICNYNV